MTQSNFGSVYPSCEVLVNGQKRKVYGKDKNKVYLNNGDEIQLKVYNPLSTRIGFQLKMNGQNTDDSILVVNPGQSVIVERFIGTNRKIVFNTYGVDKSNPQTKKAIKENGKLEIIFYNEFLDLTIPYSPTIPYTPNPTIPYSPPIWQPPTTIPPYQPYTPPYTPYYPINICGTDNDTTYSSSSGDDCLADNISNMSTDFTLTGNLNVNVNDVNIKGSKGKRKRLSETGRVEKGNRTNQYFSQTEFKAGFIIKTYVFKLKPYSEKKKEVPQTYNNPYIIQNQPQNFNNNSYVRSDYREYCSNKRCNYRIRKSNWAFCPVCGTKLD